jgi:CheY-like chemotaxis protein
MSAMHTAWIDEEVTLRTTMMGRRALVAEDNDAMRELVTEQLYTAGYIVTEVATGEQMLRTLQQASIEEYPEDAFDLIVTDICMPGRTGLDVLARIRKVGCRTPVIAITAFPDDEVRERAEALNAVLLEKPFALHTLRSAVDVFQHMHKSQSNTPWPRL